MARAPDVEARRVSDARTVILDRIERAMRTGRIPEVRPAEGLGLHSESTTLPLAAVDGARAVQASGSLADRFVLEARALGVEVFVESTPAAVRERVRALVAGLRVLSWHRDRLPYDCGTVVADALPGSAPRREQARADVGVTACHGAIAETGSLALISGPGCSRTVSLLPPFHIAVVSHEDLLATMADFFQLRHDAIARAANCTFVTGPSRTADIELSLTIGVHGPGKVAVVLGP
jgi:L-lactate dehydrogenase complex protein LldG